MLGALTLFGLQPGPLLFTTNPDFFWGLVATMYIGNVMLLILNFRSRRRSRACCESL